MHTRHVHGRRWRAASIVTAIALTALGCTALSGSGSGSTGPAPARVKPAAAGRSAVGVAVPGAGAAAVAAAQRLARASRKPAVIGAATTTTDQTLANPDGSFTLLRHALPVRARKNGAWVPVNATLLRNAGGTVSPAAVNGRLAFSGGGRGPLVSMADAAGHALSLWWPTALPAPALAGPTATYRDVLPGVDLRITASAEGGFSDVLVVRNAAAAANPALRVLRLRVRTTRLRLATGRAGNLTATDSVTGVPVFSAPTPALWDSAASRTARSAASPAGHAARALAGLPARSTAAGPGRAAHRAAIRVAISGGTLMLVPPTAVLSGPGIA
jgi:hypothetical protein